MKDRDHDDVMAELYRDDPRLAQAILSAVELDGDPAELAIIRRQIAKATDKTSKEKEEKRP
ncbi:MULTISPECIES: hypothetical protein [unclassified Brucella]|uniref:hypothetical protein n=1 Tax=unclassified Brucella TaxID=2632610 RepID=UPI001298163D|nr:MULTISPECIES: hypothetical protein [unclassified Brucella]QGA58496.1 hypothetical protein GHC20_15795 [Brucella sp. 2280]UWF68173.1 hypothetical protein NYO63_10425 [Brucella sp. 1315]UWF71290.1 hypothetical protein NYO65_10420 [Brucella sp. 2594]